MFKWILVNIICFFIYITNVAFAEHGDLFIITSNSTDSNNLSVTLCLNVNNEKPISCQNYVTKPGTLTIRTTIKNKTYLHAGIKINTPGYVYNNLLSRANGYSFIGTVSNTQPATGTLTPVSSTFTTTNPSSLAVDAGQAAIFSSTTSGGITPYNYQWQLSVDGGLSFSDIPNANLSSFAINSVSTMENGNKYRIFVTDASSNSVISAAAMLTVNSAISATLSPNTLNVDLGQSATFTANSSGGTTPYQYQWYSCTDISCTSKSIISGANNSTYSPATSTPGSYFYQATVTDATTAQVISNVVTLNVNVLSISPSTLALSVNCTSSGGDCVYSNADLTGNPRILTIQNTSTTQTTPTLTVTSADLPVGTSISADTCNNNRLTPLSYCYITITPGQVANSSCTSGTQPTPGTISINTGSGYAIANIDVLSYGCIYQGGFIYSINDNYTDYPESGSIGGSTAAVYDSVPGQYGTFEVPNWGGDGTDVGSSTYYNNSTGANDGNSNTTTITNVLGCAGSNASDIAACICSTLSVDAAGNLNCSSPDVCYTDWYLPAICQLGQSNCSGCACAPGSTNITTQLFNTIGANFVNDPSSIYWSSSENPDAPQYYAAYAVISTDNQSYGSKSYKLGIRCGRNLTP